MRVDVVSIFPGYFAPLTLSLTGRAVGSGLLDVEVHDLREFTHDRHRTVDDTPYGGGAGMVMKPEPWGEALDSVLQRREASGAVLVVPTPSGRPFTQSTAERLSREEHLVFACGRYEGIDQRVIDHYRDDAPGVTRVEELSIGDYVVNGGEVAALVMIEAVARLLPGFMGNPESLAEESHSDSGLLEYPVFTKPPVWRGREVPDVLLSGDHGRIAAWRREQSLRRTVERRPDLAHPSRIEGDLETGRATAAELGQIRTVEAAAGLPPAGVEGDRIVVRSAGRVVACGLLTGGEETDLLSRIAVAPDVPAATGLGHLAAYVVGRGRSVEVDPGPIDPGDARAALRPLGLRKREGRWLRRG